jgi:hypothetical protein
VIIFGGTEIPSNRLLLHKSNATNVMVSYWGLKKRGLPKTKEYYISEHFEDNFKIWVDSGALQADKAGLSQRELEEYAADYEEFIAINYDRIEGWVEFDSQSLGLPWIMQQRAAFQDDPKMWVVWHDIYGTMLLHKWSEEYSNIAIPNNAIESSLALAGITQNLSRKYDVKFHALASVKPDNLRQIPFSTTSTLSWLSPMRRGETIIWDGTKLVRYPKSMKDQARKRYQNIVTKAGLDFQKFINDDTLEATKVAIWSYLQLEAKMDKDKPDLKLIKGDKVSDNSDDTLYTSLMETGIGGSNNSGSEMRKVERTEVVQRDPQEMTSMPVFGYQMKTIVENENGQDVLKDIPIVNSNNVTLRQCNTCFIASNCPAFKENNTCAFNLPVEVKTPEQLRALNTTLLEMQAQRVAFMRYSEELNGGYADPNLSQEMDRYFKMLEKLKSLDEQKEFIQITAQRDASQGVLTRLFGDRVQAIKDAQQPISEDQTTMIIKKTID